MLKTKPTIRIVSATAAKNNFGAMIKSAYASDEHLIVEKSGIPVVAIIPMADYQALVKDRAADAETEARVEQEKKRAEARRRLKEVMERVHARMPDVSEEEADRDIARAIRQVRAERAKAMGLPPPLPYRQVRSRKKKRK